MVSFLICFLLFLVSCARLSWSHSAFESALNSAIVSYRITQPMTLLLRHICKHLKRQKVKNITIFCLDAAIDKCLLIWHHNYVVGRNEYVTSKPKHFQSCCIHCVIFSPLICVRCLALYKCGLIVWLIDWLIDCMGEPHGKLGDFLNFSSPRKSQFDMMATCGKNYRYWRYV